MVFKTKLQKAITLLISLGNDQNCSFASKSIRTKEKKLNDEMHETLLGT